MNRFSDVIMNSDIDWSNFVNYSSNAMIACSFLTFAALHLLSAPYGRYLSTNWGPLVPARLAWILMESPNLVISCVVFINFGSSNLTVPNRILLCCFLAHYIHRALIFPMQMKAGNPMPIGVMMLAFMYCTWNGTTQSLALIVVNKYDDSWLFDPRFIFGILLFMWGMAVNIHADYTLLNLRKPGEKGYKIPYGGMYKYVSCANYFGEIVEWIGFTVACWSLPALAFALYTFANVGPRAYKHHKWYLEKFDNYPKERKAVIPFVW